MEPMSEMPDGICETCHREECSASYELVECDMVAAEAEYSYAD